MKATILNSRQHLWPTGEDEWVKRTVEAVGFIQRKGWTLLTSIGTPTWELVTALGSWQTVPMTAYLPVLREDEIVSAVQDLRGQFESDSTHIEFQAVVADRGTGKGRRDIALLRDQAVLNDSDVVFPISIRPGGNLERLIYGPGVKNRDVDLRFSTEYKKSRTAIGYHVDPHSLNPALERLGRGFLIHWTRTAGTAWPTERLIDYYRAIVSSRKYPRSALHTLQNILWCGQIKGSPFHMPMGEPVTAFSSLAPSEVVPLMRWRSRYRQMSFEPYGIAVEKNFGLGQGIRQVCYYSGRMENVSPDERWVWQSEGRKGDWRAEHEYRFRGNFVFADLPRHHFCVLTRTKVQAEEIERQHGYQAIAMTID